MDQSNTLFLAKYKLYIFLIGIGLIVYFNSLFGSFLWDDISFIQNNPLVHSLNNFAGFFFGATVSSQNGTVAAGSYYRPFGFSIWAMLYSISGNQPFLYHFFQLFIHISNALLIFSFFKKFFKERLAFFLSFLFLVHPINSEAVDYISAMEDPLMLLFGMSALLAYAKAKNNKGFVLTGFLLLCSLLAKETGIVFLVVIFTYFLFFRRNVKSLIITSLSVLLPLIFYIFLRFFIARMPFSVGKIPDVPMMTAPLAQRLYTMPSIFWFYVRTFFFPNNLFTFQEWMVPGLTNDFFISLLLNISFISATIIFGIWIWRINKKDFWAYVFFAVWFFVGILIHIQLLPLDMTVADRYFYFGVVGIIGMLGIIIKNIGEKNKRVSSFGITVAIILLIILSVRTIIRNTNWYDGISLYSHDLQFEKNDRMENLFAVGLINANRYAEAQVHLENLLARNPKEPALYVNLAIAYEITGNFAKAGQTYGKGLSADDSGAVYYNYSRFLIEREGKITDSKNIAEKGLLKFPQNGSLWLMKAVCEYKLGEKSSALTDAKKAKSISPGIATQSVYDAIVNNQSI